MTCGFCNSSTNVQVIQLKNGYNVDKKVPVICCESCRDLLAGIAIMLSIYVTTEY